MGWTSGLACRGVAVQQRGRCSLRKSEVLAIGNATGEELVSGHSRHHLFGLGVVVDRRRLKLPALSHRRDWALRDKNLLAHFNGRLRSQQHAPLCGNRATSGGCVSAFELCGVTCTDPSAMALAENRDTLADDVCYWASESTSRRLQPESPN
jgi:hypothetical protein